jgi:membrane-associated PAP2 superfamily phosphatase
VSRGFSLSFIALGLALALLFAAYPAWDMQVAEWFFDPQSAKFPVAVSYEWNVVRRVANWVPFLLLLPALFTLLRKLIFPSEPMKMAPSIVLYLLGSFLIGPGLTSNVLLKENWGRPRPNSVQQFAGAAPFQPWWRPGDGCKRNCSFVSGEASQAFWTLAPASLAPPQVRPLALGGAVVFGTAVGSLRVVFGRHFVTDVVLAGVITLAVIMALYRLLLDPIRRNDARLERGVERVSVALHRLIGAALGATGQALAGAGSTLRSTGQHLHKRVACL